VVNAATFCANVDATPKQQEKDKICIHSEMPFNYNFNAFMKIRNACENCSLNVKNEEWRD